MQVLRIRGALQNALQYSGVAIFDGLQPAVVSRVSGTERAGDGASGGIGLCISEPRGNDVSSTPPSESIAVVGIGCRLPGGVDGPDALWRLLDAGTDATREFPEGRAVDSCHTGGGTDTTGGHRIRGGFLQRVDRFEPEAFGIPAAEAVSMDPQQRLALEVAWESLELAGYAPDRLAGSATGVYLGVSSSDYTRLRHHPHHPRENDARPHLGEPDFTAGRISQVLGLHGPSKVVDTGGSSSLVAVHDACQALRAGECDLALAGGVNLILIPYGFELLGRAGVLSRQGLCRAFDAGADGYARAEGAAVVVLKRHRDAVRDKDHVLALLRGSAVHHDGSGGPLGQEGAVGRPQVMEEALTRAGVAPAEVDYVEAHGGGLPEEDAAELRALHEAVARHRPPASPLRVGSVKTNLGHLESAAGITGLVKLVLALHHGAVPAHLHFERPAPWIGWDELNIEITAGGHLWPPAARSRVGAVSSFGLSGTHAHCVVSLPPEPEPGPFGPAGRADEASPHGVLLVSAHTEAALGDLSRRYVRELRRLPGINLDEACFTTQTGRARQRFGVAVAGDSLDGLAEALQAHGRGELDPRVLTGQLPCPGRRGVAWLMSGDGGQHVHMARGLADEPAFREPFDRCLAEFDRLLPRPLGPLVWPDIPRRVGVRERPAGGDTRYNQAALFAVEYALARMLLSWGARPAALLGHGPGEIAAACVAGVFDMADAARLVVAHGELTGHPAADGMMAAVECTEATAREAIAGHADAVGVAAVNGPQSVVLSGSREAVTHVVAGLRDRGVTGRTVNTSHACYSPLLRPLLENYRAVAQNLDYAPPQLPLMSNVSGKHFGAADVGPDYWVRQASGTIRLHDGLTGLYLDGIRTFLELGPDPLLLGLGNQIIDDPDCAWIALLRRPAPDDPSGVLHDRTAVRLALGGIALRGADVDWSAVHGGEAPRRVPLPTTVWRGDSHWFEDHGSSSAGNLPPGAAPREGAAVLGLGRRLRGAVPTYEVPLDEAFWQPFVRTDHDGGRYLALGALGKIVKAVVSDALGGHWGCLEELTWHQRIPMEDPGRTLQFTVRAAEDGHAEVQCHSISAREEASGAPWRLHGQGILRRRAAARPRRPDLEIHRYGDSLACETASLNPALVDKLTGTHRGGGGVLVALAPDDMEGSHGQVAAVDAAIAAVSWDAGTQDRSRSGTGFARVLRDVVCTEPQRVRYVRATAVGLSRDDSGPPGSGETGQEIRGEAEFFDKDGTHVGGIRELRIVDSTAVQPANAPWRRPDEVLLRLTWQQGERLPEPGPLHGQSFLLLPDSEGVAERLARELRQHGAHCLVAEDRTLPADRGAVSGLLRRWRAEAAASGEEACPQRVVVLTGLDAPGLADSDPAALVDYRDRTELLAVSLVQELARYQDTPPVKIVLVTRGAMPVLPEHGVTCPIANTLWGLGRGITEEHPELWGGVVDLDPAGPAADDIGALTSTLLGMDAEDQQALRGRDRHVARLVRGHAEPEELRRLPSIRLTGAYLITGAFGGIGQAVGHWLARHGAGKLVLLGRTPLPQRSEWDAPGHSAAVRARIAAVRELEATGVPVEVVVADVGDPEAMERVVGRAAAGDYPLRGVVHAAGVSAPQALRDIPVADPREYDAVWRPKVLGGWLLHQFTEELGLDFFLSFSSVAAIWGERRHGADGAANAFLDGLAEYRHTLGEPALTVSWGPWEMASNLFGGSALSALTERGLLPLSDRQCLQLLGMLLAGPAARAVVCAAEWPKHKAVLAAARERPVLRGVE